MPTSPSKKLLPSHRLPLLLLAKTMEHVAKSEPSKLNQSKMLEVAKKQRELAISLPAKSPQ